MARTSHTPRTARSARSATTMTTATSTLTSEVVVHRTKYHWPAIQLNIWIFIMLIASSTILGVFSYFIAVQNQLVMGIPWYFPYWVAVSALTILFIIAILYLISSRQLLPGIVILGASILFILWMIGLIAVSVELWGPAGNVNTNCQLFVWNNEQKGPNEATLAWLQQQTLCQDWTAAWAFMLVGTLFMSWVAIMAYLVYVGDGRP